MIVIAMVMAKLFDGQAIGDCDYDEHEQTVEDDCDYHAGDEEDGHADYLRTDRGACTDDGNDDVNDDNASVPTTLLYRSVFGYGCTLAYG